MTKTLVITGASKGIGRAAAQRFRDNRFRVVNISRSECPLDGITHINADMSQPDWLQSCGDDIRAAVGDSAHITLIHNACRHEKDTIAQLDAAVFQQTLQVNLIAPSQLNQLLLPLMAPGSSILYLGSTLSEKAVAGSCSYVVSKHAIVGMMRATCQDLAGTGVHTVCLCPGFTDTQMLRAHVGDSPEVLQQIAAGVTFGRLIEPGEIARTLHFCAEQPILNGAVIHANLGQIEH